MWFNCSCVGTRLYIIAPLSLLVFQSLRAFWFPPVNRKINLYDPRLPHRAHLWFVFFSSLSCREAQALICLLGDPSPWTRKAQSVPLTSISLSQQCHVAHSACLPHKWARKQPCADTASATQATLFMATWSASASHGVVLCGSAASLMGRGRGRGWCGGRTRGP